MEWQDEPTTLALRKLHVQRGWRKYPILKARVKPDLDVFSDSEIEATNAVIAEYGKKSARELVDITHEHRAYKLADGHRIRGSSVALPYEYFFEDAPREARAAAEARAEIEQEARDVAEALEVAGAEALAAQTR